MREWLLSVVETQKTKFELVCIVLWGMWQARNSLVWEGQRGKPMEVVQNVVSWYQVFLAAQVVPRVSRPVSQLKWMAPTGWSGVLGVWKWCYRMGYGAVYSTGGIIRGYLGGTSVGGEVAD
ncbi:hypothetical protein DVH24_029095 [Malus domestica]|uniref:Uncharacterized protein n=1 Tax=Malus domestica TaxID=3750 RepID=A0A498HVS1_MALDO|nr:hypothetical protein DVH24_029095 [Malus domestica]